MGGYVTSGGLFALYMQNMFKTRTGGGGLEGVEALYHAYRDDVFRLALSYTGQIADAEDISQTVLQEYFTMIMLVDAAQCTVPFADLARTLDEAGTQCGLQIRAQREDIFNAMHRI